MDNSETLNGLNMFLTARLTTVAGEIFQMFKEAFSEYQSEIERIKQENRYLKDSLAEMYNSVEQQTGNPNTTQTNMPTHLHVNLQLEANPTKSDLQPAQRNQYTSKFAHLDEDQGPGSSFLQKCVAEDKSGGTSNLQIISSYGLKEGPSASPAGISARIQQEPESFQLTEQQERLSCSNRTCSQALFTCEHCGKSFHDKGTLKKHLIVHQKERPFPCGYCKKRFKLKSHLKEHVRIHTGEKPFSCPVCMKSFARSNRLKMHLCSHREQFS